MMETHESDRTCLLCGKTRTVIIHSDDGRDFDGHQRGHSASYYENENCTCAASTSEIKKMCLNCANYNEGYCADCAFARKIDTEMFEMKKEVLIKLPTRSCSNYKPNVEEIVRELKFID